MSAQPVWSDPGAGTPVLLFGNGLANAGGTIMLPAVSLPGYAASIGWFVAQWHKSRYLDATTLVSPAVDPLLGQALYTLTAPDGSSSFSAFAMPGDPGHFVYQMSEGGGASDPLGGSNTILQTIAPPSVPVTLDQPLMVSLDAKITQAQAGGMVQVAIGPILGFNYPGTPGYSAAIPYHTAFIQIALTSSDPGGAHGCNATFMPDGSVCFGGSLPGDPLLPFVASTGGLVHMSFDISAYVQAMIADVAGAMPGWGSEVQDLGRWTVQGFCIGLEQAGPGAIGVQVANVQITTGEAASASPSPARPPDTVATAAQVDAAYTGIVRSAPDAGTQQDVLNRINAGTLMLEQLDTQLIGQVTDSTVAALVTFDAFYGDLPTSGGLDFLTRFANGLPAQGFQPLSIWIGLGASFADNGAFAAQYEAMTRDAFVDTVYATIFGHAPAAGAHAALAGSMDYYRSYAGSELGARGAVEGVMLYLAAHDANSAITKAATNFLTQAAGGTAEYAVPLLATYGPAQG